MEQINWSDAIRYIIYIAYEATCPIVFLYYSTLHRLVQVSTIGLITNYSCFRSIAGAYALLR